MSNNVTLSLPLSATALRLGATLLTDLAAHTETIYAELNRRPATSVGELTVDVSVNTEKLQEQLGAIEGADEVIAALTDSEEVTTLEQDVETAEADTVNKYANETPKEKQFRLHGNVASAGMEPITQETLPPLQYEDVVVGHERNPEYAGANAAFDQEALEAIGWTVETMLADGYLREVVERKVKDVAPSVSAAPSPVSPAPAPAPAAPAPSGSGVAVDKAGLPYDTRIHSSAAEPLAKTGFWKRKKNISDEYVAEIEAELRAVMNAGKPQAAAPTPTQSDVTGASVTALAVPAADPKPAPAPTPDTTTTVAAVAPPAPSAPAAPAPAPAPGVAPAAPTTNAFATFTRWILDHKLSPTDVVLEVQKLGLTQIPDLGKRPDLIPQVVAALQAKGLGL